MSIWGDLKNFLFVLLLNINKHEFFSNVSQTLIINSYDKSLYSLRFIIYFFKLLFWRWGWGEAWSRLGVFFLIHFLMFIIITFFNENLFPKLVLIKLLQ